MINHEIINHARKNPPALNRGKILAFNALLNISSYFDRRPINPSYTFQLENCIRVHMAAIMRSMAQPLYIRLSQEEF
ncbi:MAG: hypothetical protein CVV64_18745 [Candidatus Wallbacteria bacterium HGW-Wallbacteria-1]|uniref:Uncharacterized protein n=1 Tax=Candidatus Wallbacteria bacterium HGW-Wallbacteria-1 TaxID=2013854 RepID=A0A2N1PJD8_9BACT|nr:MAG: hypothetical protein CVV64_18745 [Candidatus Wallbacteria bacterium HGW-Wallbacteria-1]